MSSTVERSRFRRFTVSDRIEHWAQILTFIPLAVTGLVQFSSDHLLSRGIIGLLGGIEAVRDIHRVFAAVLMVAVVYHLGAIGYRRWVLGIPRSMGPQRADVAAFRQSLAYNLGREESRPRQGRFMWQEKLEYWSLVWGTGVMIVTGFLLWNPIASATFLPGSFIPAAKAAHGGEAVLAVLAIVVWHLYHVHIRHFNKAMFTGYLTDEEMRKYHPLELEAAQEASSSRPPPEELNRRRRRYLPLYSFGALVLLAGIWLFVSFEDTAIETIDPIENPVVFAPVSTTTTAPPVTTTEPPPTTVAGQAVTATTVFAGFGWDDFEPALRNRCGACHRDDARFGGLSLATFDAALAGGDGGPSIVPGDPDASPIVFVPEVGDHAARLRPEIVADLRTWIADGAPEVAGGTATAPGESTPTGVLTGWDAVAPVLEARCGACHGAAAQLGGLSLADYASALSGGQSGVVIIPGDSAGSLIVVIQLPGDHPATLTPDELADLRAWIDAGAPER